MTNPARGDIGDTANAIQTFLCRPAGAECQKKRTRALYGNTQSLCEQEPVTVIKPLQTLHQSPGVCSIEANLLPDLRVEQGRLSHEYIPTLLVVHHDLILPI